jgi:hypothetical protein
VFHEMSAELQVPRLRFGMTKERVTLPCKSVAGRGAFFITFVGRRPVTSPVEVTIDFLVTTSVAETNSYTATKLSSRPERSAVERSAVSVFDSRESP